MKRIMIFTAFIMLFSVSAFAQQDLSQLIQTQVFVDVVKPVSYATVEVEAGWKLSDGRILNGSDSKINNGGTLWLNPSAVVPTLFGVYVTETYIKVTFYDADGNALCGKEKLFDHYKMSVIYSSGLGLEWHKKMSGTIKGGE